RLTTRPAEGPRTAHPAGNRRAEHRRGPPCSRPPTSLPPAATARSEYGPEYAHSCRTAVTSATLHGMTHVPPPRAERRNLHAELCQLDARRAQVLARRAHLSPLHLPAPPPAPPAAPPTAPRRPETSAPLVQIVPLVLGRILLPVAAIAFTLVRWGHMGI